MSTLLFTLLLGIIQYGLYFNDSISARQGIRDAARSGVVQTYGICSTGTDMDKLRCNAKQQVGSLMGRTYIKIYYPTASWATASTAAWAKGNPLKVCAMVSFNGPVKLVPMPSGGWIKTQTTMSVEQDTAAPTGGLTTTDTLPSGKDWNWCKSPWDPTP